MVVLCLPDGVEIKTAGSWAQLPWYSWHAYLELLFNRRSQWLSSSWCQTEMWYLTTDFQKPEARMCCFSVENPVVSWE